MSTTVEWETKTLEELAERIDYGHTASANPAVVGPKFLRITDIQNGHVDWSTVPYCPATPDELDKYRLSDGDIVFARTGNTTGKSFLLRQPPKDSVFASYLIRVRPSLSVDSRFLAHFFDTPNYWNQIEKNAQGAGQPGVNATRLKTLEIPLPPLSEQKRIADILDKADAIRRKRQEAAALTRTLEESLFADMFLGENNRTQHKIQVLDELCSVIRDGVHKTPTYIPEGIPFVTVRNLTAQPNGISFADCKFISPEDHAEFSKRTNPELGDILVSKDGTIGVAREITGGLPFNVFVSVALLKPHRDLIHPTFLKTQFNMPFVQRQILDEIKGVAIRHLHLKDFKRLSLVVPDMQTQLEFVTRIERLQSSEDTHISAIREAQSLFNSLVQRAFKGEL